MRTRRIIIISATVLVLIVFAVSVFRRGGYSFPPVSDIVSMDARFQGPDRDLHQFQIPSGRYSEILSALSPSRRDFFPAKWQMLGELDVRKTDGKLIHVELY